jgi:hypothetical protein
MPMMPARKGGSLRNHNSDGGHLDRRPILTAAASRRSVRAIVPTRSAQRSTEANSSCYNRSANRTKMSRRNAKIICLLLYCLPPPACLPPPTCLLPPLPLCPSAPLPLCPSAPSAFPFPNPAQSNPPLELDNPNHFVGRVFTDRPSILPFPYTSQIVGPAYANRNEVSLEPAAAMAGSQCLRTGVITPPPRYSRDDLESTRPAMTNRDQLSILSTPECVAWSPEYRDL